MRASFQSFRAALAGSMPASFHQAASFPTRAERVWTCALRWGSKPTFALISAILTIRERNGEARMAEHVFGSNTPSQARNISGSPLLTLALSLSLMAGLAALVFVACAGLQ